MRKHVFCVAILCLVLLAPMDGPTWAQPSERTPALEATSAPYLGVWQDMSSSPLSRRVGHTAVWTGSEMIIWGGDYYVGLYPHYQSDGARYNPTTDSWTTISSVNAPSARADHSAVWTGSEMLVWGGERYDDPSSHVLLNDGKRYNPATDTWSDISSFNAPSARREHSAVWTGNEMIIWGGAYYGGYWHYPADGKRYNPTTDTWADMSIANAPVPRYLHTVVWTGSEMIIWGGSGDDCCINDSGGRYSPAMDAWRDMAPNASVSRTRQIAVWTGDKVIVWGGELGSDYSPIGGRYDPVTDTWAEISSVDGPAGRERHCAVWTGNQVIIWGGETRQNGPHGPERSVLNDGKRYDPTTDKWTNMAATAMDARMSHTAVWTGREMIVWGGWDGRNYFNDGGRYAPSLYQYLPLAAGGGH